MDSTLSPKSDNDSSIDPVKRARELVAAATPGPWHYHAHFIVSDCGFVGELDERQERYEGNSDLIAAAPELLSKLADECERLREQVSLATDAFESVSLERDAILSGLTKQILDAGADNERLRADLRECSQARLEAQGDLEKRVAENEHLRAVLEDIYEHAPFCEALSLHKDNCCAKNLSRMAGRALAAKEPGNGG